MNVKSTLIRHGESTANAGSRSPDVASIELTAIGWNQARQLADSWTDAPDLIVTSPFLRARQTAEPTTKRFSTVPLEIWPIQEFTYLSPERWNGTSFAERRPFVEAYWRKCDPDYCDGPGAESFNALLARAEAALDRLKSLPDDSSVLVFGHGQFMQAVRLLARLAGNLPAEFMTLFGDCGNTGIRNAECIQLAWVNGCWNVESPSPSQRTTPGVKLGVG